jgi:hypothetical protein
MVIHRWTGAVWISLERKDEPERQAPLLEDAAIAWVARESFVKEVRGHTVLLT